MANNKSGGGGGGRAGGGGGGGGQTSQQRSNELIGIASRANFNQTGNLAASILRNASAGDLARARDVARARGNTSVEGAFNGALNGR